MRQLFKDILAMMLIVISTWFSLALGIMLFFSGHLPSTFGEFGRMALAGEMLPRHGLWENMIALAACYLISMAVAVIYMNEMSGRRYRRMKGLKEGGTD